MIEGPICKKKKIYIYLYIYIYIYLYILILKKSKYFYWSIKCIKKSPLYTKMQKIKKGKNKNSQTSANKIKF